MKIYTYDFEVFKYDWTVTIKDYQTKQYIKIHNNAQALEEVIDSDNVYVGFNNKNYDYFIAKGILCGFTNLQLKELSDWLVQDDHIGWNYPKFPKCYFTFPQADVKDDMQMGLSLKEIEGHFGLNIEETQVDFNIDRPLTEEELKLTFKYNQADVDSTEFIFEQRKDYFKNKIKVGELAGIPKIKALGMTNAKLTAAMLQAEKHEYNDERNYVYPRNLKREYIPQEVFDFFDRMYDSNISDEELYKGKQSKLNFMIGPCEVTIAWGGIHGAIPHYEWTQSNGRIIRNWDVGSYYPNTMRICKYYSRSIPNPDLFDQVLKTRMEAKARGDKDTANALKLVVNTTYGAMLNRYNNLYDPLMGRSVCITGQLFLLELTLHVVTEVESAKAIQINTDGSMLEFDEKDYPRVQAIVDEWQERTGYTLEEDKVIRIVQKDVNNYLEIQEDGSVKAKGGYLVKGQSKAGAYKVNNTAIVVANALKEYFAYGTPVEKTILNDDNLFNYQIITKAGRTYSAVKHEVNGQLIAIQKVNRVYASNDTSLGKLYKIKPDGSSGLIPDLPDHCVVDNDNHLTIQDINKQFYIELAKKRVQQYIGKKGIEMAEAKTTKKAEKQLNVYQKLNKARLMFLEQKVKKSGKNPSIRFQYYELDDIVPVVTRIFNEIGLISVNCIHDDFAEMEISNTENIPEPPIIFRVPFSVMEPQTSAQNPMQSLGSCITYIRRYLYMLAMDITEPDSIDNQPQIETSSTPVVKPTQREEIKKELTKADDQASEIQIKGLKNVIKTFQDKFPNTEEFIAKLAIQTEGFTKISKADCEALIAKFSKQIESN